MPERQRNASGLARTFINKRDSVRISNETPERQMSEFNLAGADLINSKTKNQPLTVKIEGIEPVKPSPSADAVKTPVAFYHGWKIYIPREQFFNPATLVSIHNSGDEEMDKRINGCMNAEVDIIPVQFVPEMKAVIASRVKAMDIKKREMWYAKNIVGGNEEYLLREGRRVEARITGVIRTALFVEIFGVETAIPVEEVSYGRIDTLRNEYSVGERVYVILKNISRDVETGDISFTASVKEAYRDPREESIGRYVIGGQYRGVVKMIETDTNKKSAAYVRLEGIDAYCQYPDGKNPTIGDIADIVILGKNKDALQIWGKIVHIVEQ